MGNRAVITSAPFSRNKLGIYVHWNGGRASIEAFLKVCKDLGFRKPDEHSDYAWARLTHIICSYLGAKDGLSVGVGLCKDLDYDNWDNGTYLIGGDWEIVGRKFFEGGEEINQQKTDEIYAEIISKFKQEEVSVA